MENEIVRKTVRLTPKAMEGLTEVMKTNHFSTENEAINHVIGNYMGVVEQVRVLQNALGESETLVMEFEQSKAQLKGALIDLGVLMPDPYRNDPNSGYYQHELFTEEE